MASADKDIQIEQSRQFWSRRAGEELTLEDAREIRANLAEFVASLIQIDRRIKDATSASDRPCTPVTPSHSRPSRKKRPVKRRRAR